MTKNISSFIFIIFLLTNFNSIARENTNNDSTIFQSDNYIQKTGYNIAPLPEFMYDPFIGLYLGVNATIFDFGDGKKYPNFYKSLNINAAYGTKGKTNFSLKFRSYYDFILESYAGYTRSTSLPFYGFNGYQTYFNTDFQNSKQESYITKPFYNIDQTEYRLNATIQDTLGNSFFNWKVGFDMRYYNIKRVDIQKMNKGISEADRVPDTLTLYDRFVDWGLIDEGKDGGWANYLLASIVYDSRDRLTNPQSGIYSELTFRYSPRFLGNYSSALQLCAVHRQYFTLIPERLSFAYRLRYDGTFGDLPFYMRNILADDAYGIGGGWTLWGIHQNRVMANQFALANLELRAKLIRFTFINQNWYIAAVPIFHTGYLLEEMKLDLSSIDIEEQNQFFRKDYGRWYHSFGIGAKIVLNENTVIGCDWARAANPQAGGNALYIGMGYSF
ncbi:MAG: BamA/TamA family outer membrane protein [Bacteroidales bacterium]|nr:BamA/TamA family outer membrane protein [Bacteroidales bacterium]